VPEEEIRGLVDEGYTAWEMAIYFRVPSEVMRYRLLRLRLKTNDALD